jgi:hypothetical protein
LRTKIDGVDLNLVGRIRNFSEEPPVNAGKTLFAQLMDFPGPGGGRIALHQLPLLSINVCGCWRRGFDEVIVGINPTGK